MAKWTLMGHLVRMQSLPKMEIVIFEAVCC